MQRAAVFYDLPLTSPQSARRRTIVGASNRQARTRRPSQLFVTHLRSPGVAKKIRQGAPLNSSQKVEARRPRLSEQGLSPTCFPRGGRKWDLHKRTRPYGGIGSGDKTQLRCVAPIIALVWGNLRTESNPTCAQADEKVSGPAERGSGFLTTLNVARLSTSTPRVA